MAAANIIDDFEDLCLETMFFLPDYSPQYEKIQSTRNGEAILHRGYYYNWSRNNKSSTVYKCRVNLDKKECTSTFTLNNDSTFKCKLHLHDPMLPIECDVLKARIDLQDEIKVHPSISLPKF